MKCRECKKKMNTELSADMMGFLSPPTYYCNNKDCKWFGFLTKAGIPKDKEKKANIWARLCQRDANMWEEERQGEYTSPPTNWSKYDKYMRMDYTGTTYNVEKVESKI